MLFSIGFSAILPLLHIPFYTPQTNMLPEITVTPYANLLSTVTIYGSLLSQETEHFVLNYSMIGYLYVLGILFFASRFFIQIFQIIRLIIQNRVVPDGKIKLVILDREISPFSFLNYIFISTNLQNTKGWEKMIEHEKQHIRQGHTFDVLIIEFISIFQWFNPFFWMFRRALRENHEFLADHAVISHGTAPAWYKQILLNQYVGEQIVLANNFNYSLIKTRIKMMSKIKSRKITYAKILLGVLLAGSLTATFAFETKGSTEFTSSKQDLAIAQPVPETQTAQVLPVIPEKSNKAIVEEQNQQKPDGKITTKLVIDGKELEITGDETSIEKLKSIISESSNYELKAGTAQTTLIPKNNKMGEVSVVAYKSSNQSNDEEDEPYAVVEQMPEFPGGQSGLRKFIGASIKYPVEAQKKSIQGKVFVAFIVGKDGKIKNVRIARGVDPSLDQEALRVVNSMPDWIAGKQDGKNVPVSYTVPINFTLQ